MAIPSVQNQQLNGQLGAQAQLQDGIAGLIMSGVAPSGLALLTPATIFSVADAQALGITAAYDTANSTKVFKHISDFYKVAPAGAELNIMLVSNAVLMASMVDVTQAQYAQALLNYRKEISLLGISRVPPGTYAPTITAGIDPDVVSAVTNAQALGNQQFQNGYRLLTLIEARQMSVSSIGSLQNFRQGSASRVAVIAGTDLAGYAGANVGQALGKLAAIGVNRNIGEVALGAEPNTTAYLADGTTNCALASKGLLDSVNDKGYVFFTQHPTLSGFYFNDDPTATVATDDAYSISNRRVLDKASKIAFNECIQFLKSNVPVDPATGKLALGFCATIQDAIRLSGKTQMVDNGECSDFRVFVDPNQNVVATSKLTVQVRVVVNGIARTIVSQVALTNLL